VERDHARLALAPRAGILMVVQTAFAPYCASTSATRCDGLPPPAVTRPRFSPIRPETSSAVLNAPEAR
jgi:hypothetical protein